jgi:diguanylate cyclase (GGDEF)-like protein
MDGFTACALLQKLSQTRSVPVLIITALNDEASINKAFSSGATDYIAKPVNFWVLSKRITHLVQAHHAERHVHQLAYRDTLTGLPNRVMFNEFMAEALARPINENNTMALMFLDLDRFKLVNDTLGHETGDLLLKYFAERVQGCLRTDDMVARFGGDEFTILLDRVKSPEAVCSVAEKIHEQLSRPFVYMGKEMYVSTSIGIAMYPEHGEDIGTLLKGADMAMYRAKKLGDKFQFYESQMEADVSRRLQLENDLRGALDRGEFVIFYQPQEDLKSGKVTAMEALIRWEHPERGLVGPDEFIYLAEETGQILNIGDWVLRQVCQQLQDWRKRGFKMICASVNLSGKQITNPGLVEAVSSILKETGLPAQYLELEITESTIMEDPEQVIATLGELREMGLSLAIDDFGTGYSSLNYLKRFPIDVIKIDRSFVCDIVTNQVDADIVKTIIDLAHVLDVSVVAEGVETELQRAFLKKQNCDIAQGYYLSRPIPVDKIEELFLDYSSELDLMSGSLALQPRHSIWRRRESEAQLSLLPPDIEHMGS